MRRCEIKSLADRTETHYNKDCYIEFNYVGDTMFSISNSQPSDKYFVQINAIGLYFNTDSFKMAYHVVKAILDKEV